MISYMLVPLRDLLETFGDTKIGRKKAQNILSDFSCPMDKDIEDFVKDKAIVFEHAGLSRTTLVYAVGDNDVARLAAIYSISIQNINLDDSLDRKTRKKILGTGAITGENIPALLIGQLSKNFTDGNDALITGEKLMSLVFEQIARISIVVPSVLTYVDCKDVNELKKYYSSFGFEFLRKAIHPGGDELLCYVIQTKKIIDVVRKKIDTVH